MTHSISYIPVEAYVSSLRTRPSVFRTEYRNRSLYPTTSWHLFSAVSPLRESSSLDDEEPNSTPGKIDASSRFHMDMRRVLKSRSGDDDDTKHDESSMITATTRTTTPVLDVYSPMERRKRPTVLTQDVDGAIRVTSMLRHMVSIGVATEESFQIVLEAVCGRGRLRWKNKDAMVVCAADEVEKIMQELWQRQDGIVSTETCNLALRAYAACSTPRGDRRYAQKAQALLETMEENGIEPSIATYSHLVNAWAWQQGNLENGECAKNAQLNLDHLEKMNPDDATLLQALDWMLEAWSKTRSDDAPPRAEETLNKMIRIKKKNSECPSSLPNSQSYANAILACAKSRGDNSAEKAQDMLFQLFEKYEGGDLSLEPNIFAISKL